MPSEEHRETSFHRAHAVIREFARAASSVAGENPGELVELLRHTLPDHFAYEERNGGFFELLEHQGVPKRLVDGLRGEHRTFLQRLDALETSLAAGEDVSRALLSIAEDLREHEWIESISAVRAGLKTPTDPDAEPAAHGALPSAIVPEIEALVERVHALASDHRLGLLAGITVAVPSTLSIETARAALEDALSHRGIDFVDVIVATSPGPVELRDVRFHGGP